MLHLNKATLHINIQLFSLHKQKQPSLPLTALWIIFFMVPPRAAAIPKRPLFRMFMATLNPSPSSIDRQTHVLVNLTQTQHLCQNLQARFSSRFNTTRAKGPSIGTKFFTTDHLLPSRFSTGIFTSSKYT